MRWSATRARWVLLGGAVLLAITVAAFFGLARYRAGKIWQHILARNGVHVARESNGITWSQSNKERTLFTVHASRAVPQGNNQWLLHDAVLILYGTRPGHDDRIYGSEFQYDQNEGIARAMGEVHMDLQAPEPDRKPPLPGSHPSLDFSTEHESSADPGLIHVRTSGLVYMRKLGIAATGQPAEFRYQGLTCTSRGAEFDTDHSVVRLLADVKLSGQLRGAAFSLTAQRATLDRATNSADLATPFMVSGDRSARAAHTLLHMRKDGSLEAAESEGAVQLRSGTQSLQAPSLRASFGAQSIPQHASLSSGVTFTEASPVQPAQGTAKTLDLAWSSAGILQQAVATGSVTFAAHTVLNGTEIANRTSHADQAMATFAPASPKRVVLARLHLQGSAEVRSSDHGRPGQGASLLAVAADDLNSTFTPGPGGRQMAQALIGDGHTRLEQTTGDGARQTGKADHLQITFVPAPANALTSGNTAVSSAVQTGNVEITSLQAPPANPGSKTGSPPTTGWADRAVYTASAGTLALTGEEGRKADLRNAGSELEANTVTLHQGTGEVEVQGEVVATNPGEGEAPATHILADRGRLLRNAGLAEFFGDGAHPARLFQGGSQLQAAVLTLDNAHHRLSARPAAAGGAIQATFSAIASSAPSAKPVRQGAEAAPSPDLTLGREGGAGVTAPKLPEAERNTLGVTAAQMDFDDAAREATFLGNVHLTGAAGTVSADRGVALLNPVAAGSAGGPLRIANPALGGSLQRMVMQGNVHIRQPGRTGDGEQMVYTAATGDFVLTGTAAKPPRITGEQGTLVTGATLLFRNTDSTVVVAGARGNGKEAGPARVHSERDLKH